MRVIVVGVNGAAKALARIERWNGPAEVVDTRALAGVDLVLLLPDGNDPDLIERARRAGVRVAEAV